MYINSIYVFINAGKRLLKTLLKRCSEVTYQTLLHIKRDLHNIVGIGLIYTFHRLKNFIFFIYILMTLNLFLHLR